jgi:hypothetical protein
MSQDSVDVRGAASHAGLRAVGGRTLRLLLALATAGLFLSARAPAGISLDLANVVLLIVVCSATAALAATALPTMVGVLAVMTAVWSGIGFSFWFVLTASLLYSMHLLAGLCEVVPATARIERGALRPSLVRWTQVQLATVPVLALLAAFL